MKKRILVIIGRYAPGFKSGGPVRSTWNLIEALGDEYDIRVVCKDRDKGDKEQYPNIRLNEWNKVGKGLVYYIPEDGFTKELFLKLEKEVDVFYVWGCFDPYSMMLILMKWRKELKVPLIIASMGLFSPKAFRIGWVKKKILVSIFNAIGAFRNVHWSVTSELEKQELLEQVRAIPEKIHIAEDLPRQVDQDTIVKEKASNSIKIVWISRIAQKKNLIYAIQILKSVKCEVDFTIYGSVFDENYWESCKKELSELPVNVRWNWYGNLESEKVVSELKKYHVFLFPTLGENYGHVIQEALSAGCPCILSDQTPWQDLTAHKAGHVLPLDQTQAFVDAVETYAVMDKTEFDECVEAAHQYAIRNSNEKVKTTGYRALFDSL